MSRERKVSVGSFEASNRMFDLVIEVLESGVISYGSKSKEFERRIADLHGCRYGILSNSGTSSLHVALQALKILNHWDRGEVIVPATTFVATSNIVIHNGMTPVFVDVDPLTYNIDVSKIEQAITPNTKAIIPVHLFGQSANMESIMPIAEKYNLKVIEDACEAMFAMHCGFPVGCFGDVGCFSTYVAHTLVTGVGGLSTTNNPDLAGLMRSLVNHGLSIENLNVDENFSPTLTVGRRFKFAYPGHSYRITEFEAAIGLAQLESIDDQLDTRKRNARHLTAGMEAINRLFGDIVTPPYVDPSNEHTWMMFPIVLKIDCKEDLLQYLNTMGVETRDMLPILSQPFYSYLDRANYPVSANIVDRGFYVGCHHNLSTDDIQYIIDCMINYFDGVIKQDD